MREYIKSLIRGSGFDVRLRKNVPFGLEWEYDVRGLLPAAQQNLTLFDVGANVGQTAESLARVFPKSNIYSFEPVPETFAKLERNTSRLPQVVECVQMALGEEVGEAVITSDRDGRNSLLAGVTSSSSVVSKVGTVDDFCANRGVERVTVLKIDTEGFETFVLRGANEMLAKGNIDFVLAECDFARRTGEPHGDFFEIYDMLLPLGFTMVSFYTGGVDERGWIWGNMLMMREGAARRRGVMVSPNRPATFLTEA